MRRALSTDLRDRMVVDGESDANDFAIPAGDLKPAGRPALVGGGRHDDAFMRPDGSPVSARLEQQRGQAHEPKDPFVI